MNTLLSLLIDAGFVMFSKMDDGVGVAARLYSFNVIARISVEVNGHMWVNAAMNGLYIFHLRVG